MERTQKLKSYIPLADFIARMNGPGCEVLLHDVRDPDRSVVYVTSPSLTGRTPGDGMTDFAKELLRTQRWRREPFVANYVGGSRERTFRSSTFFLREGEELLARAICHETDHLKGILFKDLAEQLVNEDDYE